MTEDQIITGIKLGLLELRFLKSGQRKDIGELYICDQLVDNEVDDLCILRRVLNPWWTYPHIVTNYDGSKLISTDYEEGVPRSWHNYK